MPQAKAVETPAIARVLFAAGFLFCFTPWASPPIALSLGLILALLFANPFALIWRKYSKPLLQCSVVLLGFRMNFDQVMIAGFHGILFAAITILITLSLGAITGKMLKIPFRTSTLIASGTAICGGSAIAAVGSVTGAKESEMSVALGTVFLLNALALIIFPPIGHALHLTLPQFGTWAGVAIHDISSVMGAAKVYGADSLQTAAAVKLSRALWIVPLSIGAAIVFRKINTDKEMPIKHQIPWFIGLFLIAALIRSYVPSAVKIEPIATKIAFIGMTLTLYLIGAGLSKKSLQAVGWKPMFQGIILWLCISLGSILYILRFGS